MKKIILLSIIALIVSSCTHRLVDFTMISTKNIDFSDAGEFERADQRVEGEDRVYYLITIPLGIPNMEEAIDKAIEKTPGAIALVDGVVYSKSMWFVLTGYNSYLVEGTPLVDPTMADKGEFSKYNHCILDRNGNVKKIVSISEREYKTKKRKFKEGINK